MIYVDGASMTYGESLSDPASQAWPIILGQLTNQSVINNAGRGKSIQRMVFDTVNFCTLQQPNMVILAFGPIIRKFFVRRENNHPIDISINSGSSLYQGTSEFKSFQHLLYKYWSNHLYDAWQFLQSVVMLQAFLKSKNIPHLLINADSQKTISQLLTISQQPVNIKHELLDAFEVMTDDQILEVEQTLTALYQSIDHACYYNFEWNFNHLIKFNGHPTAEQHREIATFIHTILTNQ